MTKMTDEQIIKALECCSKEFGNCEGCPYDDDNSDCVTIKGETLMIKDTLDLINRQNAEIEQRKAEKLKLHKLIPKMLKEAKSEAYKEFAEKFKGLLKEYAPYDTLHIYEIQDRIDIVEDILTEGGNEPPKNDFKE